MGQARQVRKKKKEKPANNWEIIVVKPSRVKNQNFGSIYVFVFSFTSYSKTNNNGRKQFNFPSHKKSRNIWIA